VRAGTDYATATPTRHRVTCSTNIQDSKGDVKSSVSTGKVTGDEWNALPYNMKALLIVVRIPKDARDLSSQKSVQIGPGVQPFSCSVDTGGPIPSGKVIRA